VGHSKLTHQCVREGPQGFALLTQQRHTLMRGMSRLFRVLRMPTPRDRESPAMTGDHRWWGRASLSAARWSNGTARSRIRIFR